MQLHLTDGRSTVTEEEKAILSAAPDAHYRDNLEVLSRQILDKPAAQCNRNAPLHEPFECWRFVRDRLRGYGILPSPIEQKGEMIWRARNSTDLPSFVHDALTIALIRGFNGGGEIFQYLIATYRVPDFKTFTVPRRPDLPQLEALEENSEVPSGSFISDGYEQNAVQTYAVNLSASRQLLINGDIEQILLNGAAAGARARRTEKAAFFALLAANGKLSDGVSLFDTSVHKNDDSSAAAPSTTSVDSMRTMMGGQISPAGDHINVRPDVLLGGPGYESEFAAVRYQANSADPRGISTGTISTLTDSALSGSTAWFEFSLDFPSIALFHLPNARMPQLKRLNNPDISASDGQHFRPIHDFRMIATDYRGVACYAGA